MTRTRKLLGISCLIIAALAVSTACTGPPGSDGRAAGAAIPAASGLLPTGPDAAETALSPSSSTPSSPATITIAPADAATDISPVDPVTVTAAGGTLTDVSLTNPQGRVVSGQLTPDGRSWNATEPLGYGRTYRITATATNDRGLTSERQASFTTVTPAGVIYPSFEPPPDRGQVGVGQPIAVIFDQPPPDKAAAERALTVTTEPAVTGSWSWVDERTVHYRPQAYWAAGTRITVQANVYGVDLGAGMYGEEDRTLNLTIGPAKIATIDDATKQMTVTIDGQTVRTIPVSMGMDDSVVVAGQEISFITPSGVYVAQEKYEVKQMSSASYGLPTSYDLGYDQSIPLAVRLSNSGIFAHSAPWSVADQGVRNVSHGCINLPPDDAQWFYDTFGYGDVVTVTGTSTTLAPDDGYGDWNIPWDQWVAGSALS